MTRVDPAVPPNVVKQVLARPEDGGIPQSQWSDELRDLFNPSIAARPLHLPESGRIKTVLNKEYVYYLAFDRCGSNASHDRVEQLRAAGWQYATTDDVEMYSADNIKQKNEIRSGDRRLMKIPIGRWKEIRKAQNLAALDLINPRRQSRGPMGLQNMTPGMNTEIVDADHAIHANAVVSNAARDIAEIKEGGRASGNASVARIPKE
jgi:hypothetical protein